MRKNAPNVRLETLYANMLLQMSDVTILAKLLAFNVAPWTLAFHFAATHNLFLFFSIA